MDAALEVAANSLQARADLAATLVDDAMARAKSETYAEALDEARRGFSGPQRCFCGRRQL